MEFYYNGKDISEFVSIKSCIVRDLSGDRCDSIHIELENQDAWYQWCPEKNDEICVVEDEYSSGVMFVNSVVPEGDTYKIIATSLPVGLKKTNKSFTGRNTKEIMNICANEDGMTYELYGDSHVIPYIEKYQNGNGAFLYQLLKRESAFFKTINGKYIGITNEFAMNQDISLTLDLTSNMEGMKYVRSETKYRSVTVYSPYARSTVRDRAVEDGEDFVVALPVMDVVQAGRWARGILLDHNLQSEKLILDTTFNPSFTALSRVDTIGNTDATGEWIVQSVEHDIIQSRSHAEFMRCIRTIE